MPDRRWQLFPFLGGGDSPEREISKNKSAQAQKQRNKDDPVDAGLERRQTRVEKFAEKTEEDIVQDYNSPIHMWVSI
jgi:hypothetical protein